MLRTDSVSEHRGVQKVYRSCRLCRLSLRYLCLKLGNILDILDTILDEVIIHIFFSPFYISYSWHTSRRSSSQYVSFAKNISLSARASSTIAEVSLSVFFCKKVYKITLLLSINGIISGYRVGFHFA